MDALRDGDPKAAAQYLSYFNDEALVCHELYEGWLASTLRYLHLRGLVESEVASALAGVLRRISPNGSPPWDRDEGWRAYERLRTALIAALSAGDAGQETQDAVVEVKEAWRRSHDMDVDLFLGLFDLVIARFGEEAIGDMWENHLLKEWFATRYAAFDVSRSDWEQSFQLLVFLSFEAMHGHLCGPGREGDVEFREYADRVELEFDPCGTGGRSYRGEPLDGTPPRMEAPYGFRAIEGAYDFTWNKQGICTYCAHCCVLTEKMPARAFGYPLRVIDPPSYPRDKDAKCRYTIYKDPRSIPDHIYQRIGMTKPDATRPLGSTNGPFD